MTGPHDRPAARRAGRRTRPGTCAAALVSLAFSLSACSGGNGTSLVTGSSGTVSTATDTGLTWILTRQALEDMTTNTLALSILEQGKIYEIVRAGGMAVPGVEATIVADFKSYSGPLGMQAAVAGGLLPTGTKALLYDPEAWSMTPLVEQHNLARYTSMAVALARSHGLALIVTPGVDLTKVLDPSAVAASSSFAAFLTSKIPAATAGADIVDIQAQSGEMSAASYASFVKAAAAKIHATSPATTLVSGLSSNPPAGTVTAGELAAAMTSVLGVVNGFWLNIPDGGSTSCPECGAAQPQVAIDAVIAAFS